MERRQLIRIGLHSGAMLVLSRVREDAAEAAEAGPAGKSGAQFEQGTLHGGKFEGWQALLASTGKAVRGTVFDPRSLGGARFTGYRVRGVKRGTKLDLEFFELEDLAFEKPVGGGDGRKRRGSTTVDFEIQGNGLAGKESGQLVSEPVKVSKKDAAHLAGRYGVEIVDAAAGQSIGGFGLTASPDGRFSLSNLSFPESAGLPKSVAGRFGVGKDGSIYGVVALPKLEASGLTFDPSEVNVLKPAEDGAQPQGIGGFILALLLYAGCATLGCNKVVGVIASSDVVSPGGENDSSINISVEVGFPADDDLMVTLSTSHPALLPGVHGKEVGFESEALVSKSVPVTPQRVSRRTEVTVTGAYGTSAAETTIVFRPNNDAGVEGKVTNADGDPIANALVRALSKIADPIEKRTGKLGTYFFELTPGNYTIEASAPGYLTRSAAVTVVTADTKKVDLQLRPLTSAIVFHDETFEIANWVHYVLTDQFPQNPLSIHQEQVPKGGNPGAFRKVAIEMENNRLVRLGNVYNQGTYDPAKSGAIKFINYSSEGKYLAGFGGFAEHHPLLKQNNTIYWVRESKLSMGSGSDWSPLTANELAADAFDVIGGAPGPDHPDFSVTGAPITFGYVIETPHSENANGIDNWRVEVQVVGPCE